MKYQSTRGGVQGLSFVDSLLMGLAPDGGLLVPETIPDVTDNLTLWRDLSFVELAQRIISLYVDDIESEVLDEIIAQAYAGFDHAEVVGTQQLDDVTVLELFHGPTLAFKDVALQLLGRMFNHVLAARGEHLNILGATSGDTGSAAIASVRGQSNVDIYILYPNNKVSPLQELQMTTVPDSNVHCVAVEGSFDDCQGLMKSLFADLEFKNKYNLGAVNSVNWARVMAQIVYYGYASLRAPEACTFCVPTGNFGNVFAAYLAKQMGFPIKQLLLATNENDILARFFNSGEYARGEVHYTVSPAMDIQVASNFERFMFYHYQQDSAQLSQFMQQFADEGHAVAPLSQEVDNGQSVGVRDSVVDPLFVATSVDESHTLAAIADVHNQYNYTLDPHSAVGYAAYQALADKVQGPVVLISTAHPAKFPDAVTKATQGEQPRHPTLDRLVGLPERKQVIAAEIDAVKALFE